MPQGEGKIYLLKSLIDTKRVTNVCRIGELSPQICGVFQQTPVNYYRKRVEISGTLFSFIDFKFTVYECFNNNPNIYTGLRTLYDGYVSACTPFLPYGRYFTKKGKKSSEYQKHFSSKICTQAGSSECFS